MLSKYIFARLAIRLFWCNRWLTFAFSFLYTSEKDFLSWKVFLNTLCSLIYKILMGLCVCICISLSLSLYFSLSVYVSVIIMTQEQIIVGCPNSDSCRICYSYRYSYVRISYGDTTRAFFINIALSACIKRHKKNRMHYNL